MYSRYPHASTPCDDYLGKEWHARTFFLKNDDGGQPRNRPDVAVLVNHETADALTHTTGKAVLYLHGFQDTFFHTEHARCWQEAGFAFYALEMRRSGRALRSEKSRDDVRDLRVREEEIEAAIAHIRAQGCHTLILLGHSTGGLQAALWASDHPGSVEAVILNSPWLDHNGSEFEKGPLTRFVIKAGKYFPRLPFSQLKPTYARSLHTSFGGEFYFDTQHKRVDSAPVYAGFFRAVRLAQKEIAEGRVHITCPLLIAHSDKQGNMRNPSEEELRSSDCVLCPDDMVRLGKILNPQVQFVSVPDGRHDLALSVRPAREYYTREVIQWAQKIAESSAPLSQ